MKFKSGWYSFDLGHYRPCASTYCLYSYKGLPPLSEEQFRGEFQWLEDTKSELRVLPAEWQEFLEVEAEEDYDEEETVDIPSRLEHLVASAQQLRLTLPPAFLHFMASPGLQTRIPSCTACYFDLAEHIVPCPGSEDGYIIRFLNDQQSVLTWYLYLTPHNEHCVLVSGYWLGKNRGNTQISKKERRAALARTFVCAPSFEAFIYRFWLENVIWFKLNASPPKPLAEIEQHYVNHYVLFPHKEGADDELKDDDEDLLLLHAKMENVLQSAGWKKDDEGMLHYQTDAFLFRISSELGIQFVMLLSLSRKSEALSAMHEPMHLHLRIVCEDDGLDALLKEIIAFQTAISFQNYGRLLQDLVAAHSDEIALSGQTLNAVDSIIITELAEDAWQTAVETKASDYRRWYNEGINHKMRGDHKKAAEEFQKVAEQVPAMAEAWHNAGFSLLALGQTEQGKQALSMAAKEYSLRLERYPYNAYNYFWLACVFSLLKEKTRTLEYLARAFELNSDYLDEAEYEEDLEWLWQDADFLRLIEA